MRYKKWCAVGLAVFMAISVTGCSKNTSNHEEEQISSVYETEDMKLDTNIMAVGEEEVTLNEMLFYVYQLKATYDGSLTSEVWNFKWDENETIESYAKDEMLKEIAQIKIICQQAEKEECQLSEEEANEAAVKAGTYVASLPERAKDFHLTKELVGKIYQEHALAKKMYDVVAGTVDTQVSDDEAKTTEEKEKIIKERETKAFKEAYAAWKENYKIVVSTTLLDQISFDDEGK